MTARSKLIKMGVELLLAECTHENATTTAIERVCKTRSNCHAGQPTLFGAQLIANDLALFHWRRQNQSKSISNSAIGFQSNPTCATWRQARCAGSPFDLNEVGADELVCDSVQEAPSVCLVGSCSNCECGRNYRS